MFPKTAEGPSSNWLALQKKIPAAVGPTKKSSSSTAARKRRKIDHTGETRDALATTSHTSLGISFARSTTLEASSPSENDIKNGESLSTLRKMISGELEHSSAQQQPGKYLALDCEMVGVGLEGKESSLARVSLVNYHGAVQLDVFVRQRERVVDYRTQFSGVRPSDMVDARPFAEVQQQVAELLNDRMLVGHAVHNDLKALLLSHPRQLTRDTQVYAFKHKVTRSRWPALRHLVQQELGVTIQAGEHSSITDARATMAVFRLHRRDWEKGQRPEKPPVAHGSARKKRKVTEGEDEDLHTDESTRIRAQAEFPSGGRKGVSSGLSTVVNRRDSSAKKKWWTELGDSPSRGSIRLRATA